jgi:hypothetical protein
LTSDTRRHPSNFDKLLQIVIAKLTANKTEVEKAVRTKLTVHNPKSGKVEVELETKL